jgi:hypothetical protein
MSSGSIKRNPDMLPFSLKEFRQANSLQVSQQGPYGEKCPLTGHFYHSHNIYIYIYIYFYFLLRVPGKGAPFLFPNRIPMDSDTPSPESLVSFSFIHVCLPDSPKRNPPTYIRKKHKATVHGAPRRKKAYI